MRFAPFSPCQLRHCSESPSAFACNFSFFDFLKNKTLNNFYQLRIKFITYKKGLCGLATKTLIFLAVSEVYASLSIPCQAVIFYKVQSVLTETSQLSEFTLTS